MIENGEWRIENFGWRCDATLYSRVMPCEPTMSKLIGIEKMQCVAQINGLRRGNRTLWGHRRCGVSRAGFRAGHPAGG